MKPKFYCCFLLLFCQITLFAQIKNAIATKPTYAKIQMTSGEIYLAQVLNKDSLELTILDLQKDQKIQIEVSKIVKIEAYEPVQRYDYSYRNMLFNTSFALKKGEILYQNLALGASLISYGLHKYLTVSGGTELFSPLSGEAVSAFGAIKLSYPVGDFLRLSVNGMAYQNFLITDKTFARRIKATSYWGGLTVGSTQKNISVGYGRGKDTGSRGFEGKFWYVAGKINLNSKIDLIGEFWRVSISDPEEAVIVDVSVRFKFTKWALETGAFFATPIPTDEGVLGGAPFIGCVIPIKYGKH